MKFLFAFYLIILCVPAFTQPVLDSSILISPGDSVRYARVNNLWYPNEQMTGENYLWNFTGLEKVLFQPEVFWSASTPDSVMTGWNTPVPNYVQSFEYQPDFGLVSDSSFVEIHTNFISDTFVLKVMNFPLTYGWVYSDTLQCDSGRRIFITCKADGYGELRLPVGIYPDVVRLNVEMYCESPFGGSFLTRHFYYKQGIPGPLLFHVAAGSGTGAVLGMYYRDELKSTVNPVPPETRGGWRVHFDENKRNIYLILDSGSPSEYRYQCLNVHGHLLLQGKLRHNGNGELTFDLGNMGPPPGVYFLKVSSPEDERMMKFLIRD